MKKILISAITAAMISVACGEDSEDDDNTSALEGTYLVSSYTVNDAGCDVEGPEQTPMSSHFRLAKGNLLWSNILAFYECSDASTCDDAIVLNWSADTREGDTWTSRASYSSGSPGSPCSLGIHDLTISAPSEGQVRLEKYSYSGFFTLQASESCEPETAADYLDQMTCERLEVLAGTRID